MWFTLDTSKILCEVSDLYQSKSNDLPNKKSARIGANIVFDVPSNMEVLFHASNKTIQVKFFYYAGGSETQEQTALRNAVSETGKNSDRLFSISAKNLNCLKHGISELILDCSKVRTELNLRSCLKAIDVYEKDFKHLIVSDIIEVTQGQKLEMILSTFESEDLENFQALLESFSNMGFKEVEQVTNVLDMFLNKTNG